MDTIVTVGITIILCCVTISYYLVIRRDEKTQIFNIISAENTEDEDILYDSPTENDKIGFRDYANALAASINSTNNFTVYGIYGPWGSGKTSLMKMIKSETQSQTNIWFDAWKFKGKVSLFDALCEILGEKLQTKLKNREVKRQTNEIIKIEKKKSKINYNIRTINEYRQNMSRIIAYLNKNLDTKIIIYVDDLDRCDPADAVDFLENLKVFFDVPRISFIIGVNYDILFFEINKRFKNLTKKNRNFTEEYLAKIINVPFFIPMLEQAQIKEYICHNIKNNNVLEAVDVFSVGLEGNLRTVKRVVNTFIILNKVASKREIDINQILLAKLLVIQYRYKDIYNKILLNSNFLIQIQNFLLRRNRRPFVDFDIDKLPTELKELLFISPYFSSNELKKYISLTKEKQNEITTDNERQAQEYLTKIANGQLNDIPNLRLFSSEIRKDVVNKILVNFSHFVVEQKSKALSLLNDIFDDYIHEKLLLIYQNETVEIKLLVLLVLKNNEIDIETYLWKIISCFIDYTEDQKYRVIEFIIQLIDNGQRYCIDILEKILISNEWSFGDLLEEQMIKSLGNSHDKKAIDIIDNCIRNNNPHVVYAAFDAIGNLDVDALWDYYDVFTLDSNYRSAFFEAIMKHVDKTDTIISMLDYKNIIYFLESESEEAGQIAEINILHYLAMNIIDGDNQVNHDDAHQMQNALGEIIQCLAHIARYNEKWTVRAEAEKIKDLIEEYKDDSII